MQVSSVGIFYDDDTTNKSSPSELQSDWWPRSRFVESPFAAEAFQRAFARQSPVGEAATRVGLAAKVVDFDGEIGKPRRWVFFQVHLVAIVLLLFYDPSWFQQSSIKLLCWTPNVVLAIDVINKRWLKWLNTWQINHLFQRTTISPRWNKPLLKFEYRNINCTIPVPDHFQRLPGPGG